MFMAGIINNDKDNNNKKNDDINNKYSMFANKILLKDCLKLIVKKMVSLKQELFILQLINLKLSKIKQRINLKMNKLKVFYSNTLTDELRSRVA